MFTKTIEEVTETLIDYRGKTPPKTSCGVKLITAKIIKDGFVKITILSISQKKPTKLGCGAECRNSGIFL